MSAWSLQLSRQKEARLNRRVDRIRTRPWRRWSMTACNCDTCTGRGWSPPDREGRIHDARFWWWVQAREWLVTISPLHAVVLGEPECCPRNAIVLECAEPDPAALLVELRRQGYRVKVESRAPYVIEIDDVIPVEVRFVREDEPTRGETRSSLDAINRLIRERWPRGFVQYVKERGEPEPVPWTPPREAPPRILYDPLPGFEDV
jgi:hypothetical protein